MDFKDEKFCSENKGALLQAINDVIDTGGNIELPTHNFNFDSIELHYLENKKKEFIEVFQNVIKNKNLIKQLWKQVIRFLN